MYLIKALLLGILVIPASCIAANLASQTSTFFEVVGVDNRSVSHMSALAEHVAEQVNKYLPDEGVEFPQRILIALRPEEHVDFPGLTKISLGDQGTVRLDFKWTEELTMQQSCFAVTQAYLTRYAIYQFGPSAPEKLPAWPIHALALQSYFSLRPAGLISQIQESRTAKFVELDALLSTPLNSSVSANFSHHAYYWLLALRDNLANREDLRKTMTLSLSGGNPSEPIAERVLPLIQLPEEEVLTLGMWWGQQCDEIIMSDYDRFETMADSRAWLEMMADFSGFAENGGEWKNMRSLWKLRDDEKMREILQARHEIISLRLEIVNPLYFNAASSLGALYESVLDETVPSHRFMHALVIYLGDFQDAKKIEATVNDRLDGK